MLYFDEGSQPVSTGVRDVSTISDLINSFVELSTGKETLDGFLTRLRMKTGCLSVAITRLSTQTSSWDLAGMSSAGSRERILAFHEAGMVLAWSALSCLKVGCSFTLSQIKGSDDLFAAHASAARNYPSDIRYFALSRAENERIILELQFGRSSQPDDEALSDVLTLLAQLFRNDGERLVRKGIEEQFMKGVATSIPASGLNGSKPLILSTANSYDLTRCEWRVCLYVARGFCAKAISGELGISVATVRAHLRSVYAKTSTASFQGLALRLMSSDEQSVLSDLAEVA